MKNTIVLLLVLLFLSSAVPAADKPLGVEEFTSMEELALSLSSYFPKVKGTVTAVQGDRLTLSLNKKDGLIPGMMLTLWRDGKEIVHPVTGAVIGRAEDEVAAIEVVSVSDTASTALVKKKQKDPVEGDRARITPRKINVAVLPLRQDHPEIVRALSERLNELGRFTVMDQAKVDAFVKNSKTMGTSTVKELGSAFGLDAVISLGVYPTEGKQMVTARIFYTEDASQLDTVVAMLDMKTGKEALGEVKPFFTPLAEEKTSTPELPFLAQFFVAGDFEGSGKPEYAFSDGVRLHVYRNEPSGWREVWTETAATPGATVMEWGDNVTNTKQGTSVQQFNLDSADINGNGRPELFVTVMVNGKVFSRVIEFQDGTFKQIAEIPGFLRVIDYPGRGSVLIGQAYDPATFYAGQPKQYSWSRGSYEAGAEISVPKGLGLYGWIFANLGERQPLLVTMDDDDHILVYSGETLAWKSAEEYTSMAAYVYRPARGIESVLTKSGGSDKSQRFRLKGRLLALDLNSDGKDEIFVAKNIRGTFIGGFVSAELNGLSWTGARLDATWKIKEIPGPVLDFRQMQQDQAANRLGALVRTKGSVFTKDRQQVMLYTVK